MTDAAPPSPRPAPPAGTPLRTAMSLTRRLALLLALFLLTGGTVIAVLSFSYGKQAAQQTFDRLILGAASQIADSISVQDGRIVSDLPVSAFELLALAPDDRVFYAVRGPDGALITGDPLTAPTGRGTRFFDGTVDDEAARYVAVDRIFSERAFSGVVTVIVGQTGRARSELAVEITRNALAASALAGVLFIGLSILIARSALGPLRDIEAALRARSPQDVSPLDLPVPREIARLVAALNGFMQRLERNLSMNRRLIADASHQIRTPIAALRAQAELAADEDDPARLKRIAERIHARSIDLTRLTEQMLSRAMIIHRADAEPQLRIDLREVAMDAAEEVGDALPARRRDLRLDLPDQPVQAMADALSLREATKNLVMNALQYGKAPVRIAVRQATPDRAGDPARTSVLAVQDAGTGPLPDAGPPRRHGAGLGLQIVQAVVQAHGGELHRTRSAEGYEVAMALPAPPREPETP